MTPGAGAALGKLACLFLLVTNCGDILSENLYDSLKSCFLMHI